MITKAIVQSINANGTRCRVRMPLFELSSSTTPVEAEALVNITPGVFNNLVVGDIVFIAFEENEIEKPIILGKLFRGATIENDIRGGGGVFDTLKVKSTAILPASTIFNFPTSGQQNYANLSSPKQMADYIKWLEALSKQTGTKLENYFNCFKNWTQWQLRPENVEIDDGDLDEEQDIPKPFLNQEEGASCKICTTCLNTKGIRCYAPLDLNKKIYPKT